MTSSAVDIVPCATFVGCTDDELHVTLTDGRKPTVRGLLRGEGVRR
jgi:hypothetical protein